MQQHTFNTIAMSFKPLEDLRLPSLEPSERHGDRLRGFAYLESFDELRAWSQHDVEPLARSNTPLLKRQALPSSSNEPTSKVMLIHDYQGGYNPYESCQGASADKDMYSCEYLQHVETFVYFSHKLVTIPPPTWINTCHRNGVYCLGTFIVEPGSKDVECILEQDDLGSFWVAHQLALIAKTYGFDGWLVNIEESFPVLSWSVDKMEGFLLQLRQEVGISRRVVWYDALTNVNFVWYQNSLNLMNLIFARAAGSILTNYAWNPNLARSSRHLAEKSGLGVSNVYFGIDVWAQNFQTGRNRRVTFPIEGGGGTGTGLGLRSLAELGLGAGIFAPGWSFEHFSTNCRAVERSVWLGDHLPTDLSCECYPECPHDAVPYQHNGIVKYATRYPSGARAFFYTNFARALNATAGSTFSAHMGAQSVLPMLKTAKLMPVTEMGSPTCSATGAGYVSTELSNAPARLVISTHIAQEHGSCSPVAALLPLFDVCISDSEIYQLSASFRCPRKLDYTLTLVIQWSGAHHHRIEIPNTHEDVQTADELLPYRAGYITGTFLEVLCNDPRQFAGRKTDILELFSITIRPSGHQASCKITDLRLEHRGEAENRLVWAVSGAGTSHPGMPYSSVTGPCAYFTVEIDGCTAGRAYALEFVVPDHFEEKCKLEGVIRVRVIAAGFDGRKLVETSQSIKWPSTDDGWVWVAHEDGHAGGMT